MKNVFTMKWSRLIGKKWKNNVLTKKKVWYNQEFQWTYFDYGKVLILFNVLPSLAKLLRFA